MAESEYAPKFSPFFSFQLQYVSLTNRKFVGSANELSKMIFGTLGAAYGTAKAGIAISGSLIPVIMSGIIAVYGLVVAVVIHGDLNRSESQALYTGFMHLGAGLSVGFTGLAAGYAIGIVGDAGVRAYMQQSRVYVGMILILIFAEVLGLYGLIVGLILNSKSRA
ncbi:V-type proton ATPase proteolipid subunit [Aspergillus tanneri]|uniref:V-type proton ATPase proteolipid subunit n=2 Tax=Aspergillus tanneri TaxID=1220188 RepID=A0A5M9N3J8_9EURO|nr:v-type proton ATPase 16 kDa proteolipid subunit 2 [Aspergillus tanneri]KAA8651773.1 v-type proton ATPase 16 kDa proteolipid subunit 2 [Aspergillus tanneri]